MEIDKIEFIATIFFSFVSHAINCITVTSITEQQDCWAHAIVVRVKMPTRANWEAIAE